jgi:hypothetical protein
MKPSVEQTHRQPAVAWVAVNQLPRNHDEAVVHPTILPEVVLVRVEARSR